MNSTLEERLQSADPARQLAPYSASEAADLVRRATTNTPSRRRLAGLAVAALALALAIPVGMSVLSSQGGATAAAADMLDRAARAAADPPARPDQYWKITIRRVSSDIIGEGQWGEPGTASALRRLSRTTYVAVDGNRPSWFVDRLGPYVRQVSGPRADLPKVGWGAPDIWTSNRSPAMDGVTALVDLPINTAGLRSKLYGLAAGRGQSLDGEVLEIVADILDTGLAKAQLRSALLDVLKSVPGVEVSPEVATLDGRRGIAVGRLEGVSRTRRELIFDPATADLIGTRTVFLTLSNAAWESAISRTLVDQVPAELRAVATHFVCTEDANKTSVCRPR